MSKYCTPKGIKALLFGFFILLWGCSSNDDNSPSQTDPFYRGALVKADLKLLDKYWSIFEVNYQQETMEVFKLYDNCDRDFFVFRNDGTYKEYVVNDSGCIPNVQDLQWGFNKGVITLENSFKDYNEMVILQLTADKLIFRAKFDIDEDGEEDILQFLAKPHVPNEAYFYSNNLVEDETVSNKIRLTWAEYEGINNFDRYEIHLSNFCNPAQSTLVDTIRDKEITYFEDVDPPTDTYFCYTLKVYTDKGLLFTSYPISKNADSFAVPSVGLEEPVALNNTISLQWAKYEGLYFSHYEVVVKNFLDSFGYLSQEKSLIKIFDINTTNFIDEVPPYIKNPVYEIRVYNEFGKQNYYNSQVVVGARATDYLPERVIDLKNVFNLAPSPTETVIFLQGNRDEIYDPYIIRYNYVTRQVEAVSNVRVFSNDTNRNDLKIVNSSNGSELMYLGQEGISVFDPETLQYKYSLKINGTSALEDFIYLGNDRFLLLDYRYAYTVLRDFSNLTLLDKQEHFVQDNSQYNYHVLQIDNDRIIIGNRSMAKSIVFNISATGKLMDKSSVDIPITAIRHGETVIDPRDHTLINFKENRIYNLTSAALRSFEQPHFPMALSADGGQIIGTNNNPEWSVEPESLHEKKVRILDLNGAQLNVIDTEGYPQYLFENHLGQLVSLSTYFKRDNPASNTDRPDFFMEIVR